jgi:hypothetical protein
MFVHVKKGWGSSLVDVVCRQAIDAAICFRRWPPVWEQLSKLASCCQTVDPISNESDIVICIALIIPNTREWHDIPIKSALAILDAKKQIRSLGYGFRLMRIDQEVLYTP